MKVELKRQGKKCLNMWNLLIYGKTYINGNNVPVDFPSITLFLHGQPIRGFGMTPV